MLRRSGEGENVIGPGVRGKGKNKAGGKQQQQQQPSGEARVVKKPSKQQQQQQQQQKSRSPSPPSPPSPTHITLDPHLSFYQGGYPAPLGTQPHSQPDATKSTCLADGDVCAGWTGSISSSTAAAAVDQALHAGPPTLQSLLQHK